MKKRSDWQQTGAGRRFLFICWLPFTAGVSFRWRVWNTLILYHFFIYFSLGNKTLAILLVNHSSVDGLFCLRLKKESGFLRLFFFFFTLVEAYFRFRVIVAVYGYRGTCLPSLLFSDSGWVKPSQGSTQELCPKECLQIPEDCEFLAMLFFPCCSNSRHSPHGAGA